MSTKVGRKAGVDRDGYPYIPELVCSGNCDKCAKEICVEDVVEENEEEIAKMRPYEPLDEEEIIENEKELFYGYEADELDWED